MAKPRTEVTPLGHVSCFEVIYCALITTPLYYFTVPYLFLFPNMFVFIGINSNCEFTASFRQMASRHDSGHKLYASWTAFILNVQTKQSNPVVETITVYNHFSCNAFLTSCSTTDLSHIYFII